MEIILKKNRGLICFFSLIFLVSCSDNLVFTEYKTLKNSTWKSNEKLTFNFTVKDTIQPKNLFIHVRNNKDYAFSNLYLITSLNFANGTIIIDTLQYEMTDEYGAFLGKGFSNIKENKLFYKEAKIFPTKGEYQFIIYHAMRKQGEIEPISTLKGIQDVGFSIEN